jgi:hypothetical protein
MTPHLMAGDRFKHRQTAKEYTFLYMAMDAMKGTPSVCLREKHTGDYFTLPAANFLENLPDPAQGWVPAFERMAPPAGAIVNEQAQLRSVDDCCFDVAKAESGPSLPAHVARQFQPEPPQPEPIPPVRKKVVIPDFHGSLAQTALALAQQRLNAGDDLRDVFGEGLVNVARNVYQSRKEQTLSKNGT